MSAQHSSPALLKAGIGNEKKSERKQRKAPLVERYRPKSLGDIVGQKNVVNVLRGFVKQKNPPNMMLSGVPGVGKTSAAFAFAGDFYRSFGITDWSSMVLSINASQENGIETIRQKVVPFVRVKYNHDPRITEQLARATATDGLDMRNLTVPKLVILDEADTMTKEAQWALGPTIDQTGINARYILIVNHQRDVQPELQSRFLVLRFPPLSRVAINTLVRAVCAKEHIPIEPRAADALGVVSQSDMRTAINNLSACVLKLGRAGDCENNADQCDVQQPLLTQSFVYESSGRVQPVETRRLLHHLLFKPHDAQAYLLSHTVCAIEDHISANNMSITQVIADMFAVALQIFAPVPELDHVDATETIDQAVNGEKADADVDPEDADVTKRLEELFSNVDFAMGFFEQLAETENNLLAITDSARLSLQTRAFAAGLWRLSDRWAGLVRDH